MSSNLVPGETTKNQIQKSARKLLHDRIEDCRNFQQPDIEECLSNGDRATAKTWMKPQGECELATDRIKAIEPIIQRQWPEKSKTWASILVAAISAVIFGAVGQIFTFRLPSWLSIPASGIGGIFIGAIAENRSKRVVTHCKLKHITKNVLKELEKNQQAANNEFDCEYYNAQIVFLQTVEGNKYLKEQSPWDAIVASTLTVLESGAAFYLALPTGMIFALLAAGVPVVVIWAAAAVLSDYIEVPEEYAKLISEYENSDPWQDFSEEQIIEIRRTISGIKFTLANVTGSLIKNREMAEFDADMLYWSQKEQMLKEEFVQAIYQVDEEYEIAKSQLEENTAAMHQVSRKGLGYEEYQKRQAEATKERELQVEQKKQKLEAQKQQKLSQIKDTYGLKIKHCEQQYEEAKMRYDLAYEQWLNSQQVSRFQLGE
jgi:hypothetical protein